VQTEVRFPLCDTFRANKQKVNDWEVMWSVFVASQSTVRISFLANQHICLEEFDSSREVKRG
jgi:hypothetical protein